MKSEQIHSSSAIPFQEPLSRRFWPAFVALIDELADGGYFSAAFGFQSPCGNQGGCDPASFSRAVRQHLGHSDWPVTDPSSLSKTELLSTIEFLRQYVATPVWSTCGWCEAQHVVGGTPETAVETYDERVNDMFRRFTQPYSLTSGRVLRGRSEVASKLLPGTERYTSDPHLQSLIEAAVADFFDAKEDRRLTALHAIVDAFERVKALLNPEKRRSVEQLVARLSPEPDLAATFDSLLRNLTTIGNRYSIRHHEPNQVPLADPEVVEFLFLSYFNVVRFALQRVGSHGGTE